MAAKPISENRLRKIIEDELLSFEEEGVRSWDLYLKQLEIKNWLPKQDQSKIDWVKRLIWMPQGRSDFRRIEPELIHVNSHFEFQAKNFWGEPTTREYPSNEPLDEHWKILRRLISTARDNGGGGMRMLKFLVRDKTTKKYLGVICIGSDFMDLSGRDEVIGWGKKEFQRREGQYFGNLNSIAQGQAIVPTQPFGQAFNGVKLLALLCLSKEIADKWEEVYGDKLVAVTTTALWGNDKKFSSYDGLEPFWMRLKDTSGDTAFRFTDRTYKLIKQWILEKYPGNHHRLFVEKNIHGKKKTRDSKNQSILFALQRLGFPNEKRKSKAVRLAYMSFLYKNSNLFLKNEISRDELLPAFDNSTKALVRFWKYGLRGDTTVSLSKAQKKLLREKYPTLPQDPSRNFNASAKARIDLVVHRAEESEQEYRIPTEGRSVEWYEDLATLTWDEAKAKYLDQVGR
jgi:hypothetical protein